MKTEKNEFKNVKVSAGPGGWGGPLIISPTKEKCFVVSVTGGGIHPLAKKIAELSGCIAVDGFKGGMQFEKMACVVIDCGGTARVGVYPMKKIPTIDIYATIPSGPLFRFITKDIFVSGVKLENIQLE